MAHVVQRHDAFARGEPGVARVEGDVDGKAQQQQRHASRRDQHRDRVQPLGSSLSSHSRHHLFTILSWPDRSAVEEDYRRQR